MNPNINILTEFENNKGPYSSFKERLFAYLIDILILLPLLALDWFDKTNWKSVSLIVIIIVIGGIYKPFCEYKYGATVGKYCMKLLVVNKEFKKANLQNVLFRNIFEISFRLYSLIITVLIFTKPEFIYSHSLKEYAAISNSIINKNWYLIISLTLTITDIVFFLVDEQKRALHDRIGDTFVIKKSK